MRILDLFAGVGGERRRPMLEAQGHELITLDYDPKFKCNVTCDIMSPLIISWLKEYGKFDIIWASPPCEAFSVMSIGKHWDLDKRPKSDGARRGIQIVERTIEIIKALDPKYFYIENPRGMMRTLPIMRQFLRATVTYCQYGHTVMKPTDIWTNDIDWAMSARSCRNGDDCHEASPRGPALSGTQAIQGAAERAVVPLDLWKEILSRSTSWASLSFSQRSLCR